MADSKTSKRRLKASERRAQALNLRRSGASYREIGSQLGISAQAVFKHVKTEMDNLAKAASEEAELIRQMEIDRLDRMLMGIWVQAAGGNLKAIDRVLRIMERRAKLKGIDAPEQIHSTVTELAWPWEVNGSATKAPPDAGTRGEEPCEVSGSRLRTTVGKNGSGGG